MRKKYPKTPAMQQPRDYRFHKLLFNNRKEMKIIPQIKSSGKK
jgi:hypothetical protein